MELIFHPDVKDDIASLDGSTKNRLKKILKKIKNAPELGKPLGNKDNLDLSGCLKIYFYKKKYRVVYEILEDNRVLIWSIGKREDQKVKYVCYN